MRCLTAHDFGLLLSPGLLHGDAACVEDGIVREARSAVKVCRRRCVVGGVCISVRAERRNDNGNVPFYLNPKRVPDDFFFFFIFREATLFGSDRVDELFSLTRVSILE